MRWKRGGDPLVCRTPPGALLAWLEENLPLATPDACLLWPFYCAPNGYAKMQHEGAMHLVHRVVCEKAHGPAPADKPQAAHRCGVRACVNQHHVRWASQAENEEDKIVHGTRIRSTRPRPRAAPAPSGEHSTPPPL